MQVGRRAPSHQVSTITNSMRSTFARCRRRFWYSYVLMLTPRMEPIYFFIGNLFHKSLAAWYTGSKKRRILRRVDEAFSQANKRWLAEGDLRKMEVARGATMGLLSAYYDEYVERDLEELEIIEAEVVFERDLRGLPEGWSMSGVLDLLYRRRRTGALGFMEHKTTSMLNQDYIGRIPVDTQIHQYHVGARGKMGEWPEEVQYNVAKKSQLRQKKTESFEQFVGRVESDYKVDPGKYFWRGVIQIPKWSVRRFKEGLITVTRLIAEGYRLSRADPGAAKEFFYMNTEDCFARGRCAFFDLCSTNENPGIMKRMYEVRVRANPELQKEREIWE